MGRKLCKKNEYFKDKQVIKTFQIFIGGGAGCGKPHIFKINYPENFEMLIHHGGNSVKPQALLLALKCVTTVTIDG